MTVTDLVASSEGRFTAHEFVRETLRRAILTGALAGGTHLVQAGIAKQLNVSTTPVREALRDLVADGLAVSKPHVGTVVRGLNLDEFVELYEVRKALEPIMIRKAAKCVTEEQLQEAEAIIDQLDDLIDDPAKWANLNWRFHTVVEECVQSSLLAPLLKQVQEMAAVYVAHSARMRGHWLRERNRDHRDLLKALRARDPDKAAIVIINHLDATLTSILAERALGSDLDG